MGSLTGSSPSPTGNGSWSVLLQPREEDVPLAALELLRVLLGVREGAELVLELCADRALDRGEPLRLEQHLQAVTHLHLADDVALGRVHRDRRGRFRKQLVDDDCGLAQADLCDPAGDRVAVPCRELAVQLDVDQLLLADLARKLVDRVADADDLRVRERRTPRASCPPAPGLPRPRSSSALPAFRRRRGRVTTRRAAGTSG